jgi:hypothetical protein
MLDKLITYIVCWYRTLYQVLPVAITTRSDTGSHNRLDLIHNLVPPHYVCNGYISLFSDITLYHIFRLKYRCFVYALSMIVPRLYRLYPISHTLYRIPKKILNFKIFQNFIKFQQLRNNSWQA